MPDREKFEAELRDPSKDANHRFSDVAHYLLATGWSKRQKGSHVIFRKAGCPRIVIQADGGKAKAYQIRQIRKTLFP